MDANDNLKTRTNWFEVFGSHFSVSGIRVNLRGEKFLSSLRSFAANSGSSQLVFVRVSSFRFRFWGRDIHSVILHHAAEIQRTMKLRIGIFTGVGA